MKEIIIELIRQNASAMITAILITLIVLLVVYEAIVILDEIRTKR